MSNFTKAINYLQEPFQNGGKQRAKYSELRTDILRARKQLTKWKTEDNVRLFPNQCKTNRWVKLYKK